MIRKSIFTGIFFTLIASAGFAQTYKPFKVDIGLLYGLPTDEAFKSGVGFYVEPKYNVTDNIATGLRAEWAVIGAADIEGGSVDVSAIGSYLITGDYYFGTEKVRPFAGAGLGLYTLGTVSSSFAGTVTEVELGNKFGFAPRVGLLLGHFRLALDYNIITGTDVTQNYLALKAGFEIGGGKN